MRSLQTFIAAVFIVSVFGISGVSCARGVHFVRVAPPARKVVVVKHKSPYKNGVWVSGHWVWKSNRHVWTEGYWVKPKPGFIWIDGQWKNSPRGWKWIKGHWKKV